MAALAVRPATFAPTTTSDYPVSGSGISVNSSTGVIAGGSGNGQITLRSAVIAANANSGSTINLPAGTYQLTLPPGADEGNVDPVPTTGTLTVLASVTIKGAGPGQTILQAGTSLANSIDQIMVLNAYYWSTGESAVVNNFSATVTGITFQYGKCINTNGQSGNFLGGAISFDAGYNNGDPITPGSLLVSNCVFNSCMSQLAGGAIGTFDGGTQTYVNCLFTNCNVNSTLEDNVVGGAICIGNTTINPGTMTISNCTFINNQALTGEGAALAFNGGNPVYFVHRCLFTGNQAGSLGGAIYSIANNLTIDQGTVFSNNVSLGNVVQAGGFTSTNVASGGAVYLEYGPDLITNCTFVKNTASTSAPEQPGGGAISLSDIDFSNSSDQPEATNCTIVGCRFYGNVASKGSGLYKDEFEGNVIANNNWWGNNAGPGQNGADSAAIAAGSTGTLTDSTWLVLSGTASPATILVDGTSTISANFAKNSAGASGFSIPDGVEFSFSGTLGTMSPGNATLSGGTASSTFTAGATGGDGKAAVTVDAETLDVPVTVDQPPAITSADNATFVANSNGSFGFTASGFPAPVFSLSGALPSLLSLNPTTGVLSGTPAQGTGGTYALTVTASNAVGTNIQAFTLTVNQSPAITSANVTIFLASLTNSFSFAGSGPPAPGFTLSGTLPANVRFNAGALSGTPPLGSGGAYPLTVTATNGILPNGTQNFTLNVLEPEEFAAHPTFNTNGFGWALNGDTVNGGPSITNNVFTPTDGSSGENRSAWFRYPLYVGAFEASFTYQDVSTGGADGSAFVIQNSSSGTAALGGGGSGLAYLGISPSVALMLDIYSGAPGGPSGWLVATNGQGDGAGYSSPDYQSTAPVNLDGGNPINVGLRYTGGILQISLTDTVTSASLTTNVAINIPGFVGTNTAWVGITGSEGGVLSHQSVSDFSYVPLPTMAVSAVGTGSLLFTWPEAIYGFTLQATTNLADSAAWAPVSATIGQTNNLNQVVVPASGRVEFYRLAL
jgi:predicted outer membrane repeat protein